MAHLFLILWFSSFVILLFSVPCSWKKKKHETKPPPGMVIKVVTVKTRPGVRHYQHYRAAARRYSIPVENLMAIGYIESRHVPDCVSSSGAVGVMQLMPATARWTCGSIDLRNPRENIMCGTKYFRQLLIKYGWNYKLALAAYNAGPGVVDRYHGVPPYYVTRRYIVKYYHHRKRYRSKLYRRTIIFHEADNLQKQIRGGSTIAF